MRSMDSDPPPWGDPCQCPRQFNASHSGAAKQGNRERSKTRSKLEHGFGHREMGMEGKWTGCIGFARLPA
ncbi:MAG: hypothetical protein TE42_01115 [Candidatus Synechococcus spongiarum SP3]|uniref:Uncharacterized protein n=1 Tax=Candidatus Synechococcus spongiarum SP3 TaxID=1604020 RepID=A0A0G2IX17_9SYNE|nr:MAG: hypothetical protein TE42_01115 [Candidatus Synechococcus spongiarum SP3]